MLAVKLVGIGWNAFAKQARIGLKNIRDKMISNENSHLVRQGRGKRTANLFDGLGNIAPKGMALENWRIHCIGCLPRKCKARFICRIFGATCIK